MSGTACSACRHLLAPLLKLGQQWFTFRSLSQPVMQHLSAVQGPPRKLCDSCEPAVQVPQSSNLSHVLPYLLKLAISDPQLYWRLGAALVAMILSKSAGEAN